MCMVCSSSQDVLFFDQGGTSDFDAPDLRGSVDPRSSSCVEGA
jgi:hypothetical protein